MFSKLSSVIWSKRPRHWRTASMSRADRARSWILPESFKLSSVCSVLAACLRSDGLVFPWLSWIRSLTRLCKRARMISKDSIDADRWISQSRRSMLRDVMARASLVESFTAFAKSDTVRVASPMMSCPSSTRELPASNFGTRVRVMRSAAACSSFSRMRRPSESRRGAATCSTILSISSWGTLSDESEGEVGETPTSPAAKR